MLLRLNLFESFFIIRHKDLPTLPRLEAARHIETTQTDPRAQTKRRPV